MKKRFTLATVLQQLKTSLNPFTEEAQAAPPTAAQQVRAALDYCRLNELYEGGPEIIGPLLEATQSRDTVLVGRARTVLTSLRNPATREALARLAMQPDQSVARQIVVEHGYKPMVVTSTDLAVFYYLTDQWDKYNQLDADRRLLSRAYREADETTRKQLVEASRANGRIELLAAIVGRPSLPVRLSELSEADWDLRTEELFAGRRWIEVWELVQAAPPLQSARILRRLHKADWHLPDPAHEIALYQLKELARRTDPAGPLLGRTTRLKSKLKLPDVKPDASVKSVVISPDGKLIAAAIHTIKGAIRIYYRAGDKVELAHEIAPPEEATKNKYLLIDMSFSSDSSELRVLEGWRPPEGHYKQKVRTIQLSDNEQSVGLPFELKNNYWFSGQWDLGNEIYFDYPANKKVYFRTMSNHEVTLRADCDYKGSWLLWRLGHDKKRLVFHDKSGTIQLYNCEHGQLIKRLKLESFWPQKLAFSPDNTLLAASRYSKLALWRLDNNEEAPFLVTGRADNTLGIPSFTPDQRVVVMRHYSGKIRLWDVATGRHLQTLKGHGAPVRSLHVSADSTTITSISADGSLRVWTSRLREIVQKPLSEGNVGDLLWVQKMVKDTALSKSERGWLNFCLALLKWQYRYEVEIGDTTDQAVIVRDDDIELEGL